MEIAHSERRENRLQQLFSRFVSVVACFMFPFSTRNKSSASTIWGGNPALYIKPREAQSVISCYLKAFLLTLKVNHSLSRAPQPQLEQARCRNQPGALRETPHPPTATYQQWQRISSAGQPEHANTPMAPSAIFSKEDRSLTQVPPHAGAGRQALSYGEGDRWWGFAISTTAYSRASCSEPFTAFTTETSLPTALLLLHVIS